MVTISITWNQKNNLSYNDSGFDLYRDLLHFSILLQFGCNRLKVKNRFSSEGGASFKPAVMSAFFVPRGRIDGRWLMVDWVWRCGISPLIAKSAYLHIEHSSIINHRSSDIEFVNLSSGAYDKTGAVKKKSKKYLTLSCTRSLPLKFCSKVAKSVLRPVTFYLHALLELNSCAHQLFLA